VRDDRRKWSKGARRGRLAVCGAVALLALGTAVAAEASGQPGPVSPKVLAALNAGGKEFVPVRHGRSSISQKAAIGHALSAAPWRGCADGISLLRTTERSTPSAAGTRVWLVSVHPTRRVMTAGGGPAHRSRSSRAANYFVVAVTADHGRYVAAQDGYARRLPHWTRSRPMRCVEG
jgi:hypothetical protein